VESSATGSLPPWSGPWLAGAKLIPLLKPCGGVRPIAVGEVLRRLTSKVLQRRLSSQLTDILAPLQMGVGVRGATEQISRKLQGLLNANPGLQVLQVDVSNAFNSVDRHAIQRALGELAPDLLPWFEFTHGQPSPLFCRTEQLWSTQGTQQGDPLGPAFFAVAIQRIIARVQDLPGTDWQVWYLDDGVLIGEPEALLNALHHINLGFQELGMQVNLAKCKMWSPRGLSTDNAVQFLDWNSPKAVLGTPFGSDAAIAQFLADVRSKHHALLQRLAKFPDPQVGLSLLRYCLGAQKVNHLLRVLWSPLASDFADSTEQDLRFTLDCVLGSCLPDSAWAQSCLPIRLGGLGVQNPKLIHSSAHFSSALADYAGAFSPEGETAPATDELWAAASELCSESESPELSQ
jgi:hypothetical protein